MAPGTTGTRLWRRTCVDRLCSQFLDLRCNAKHLVETGKASHNSQAWRMARLHLADRRTRHHMTDMIDELLPRYLAFCGCTTSGVEQQFSKVKRVLNEYRQSMSDANKDAVTRAAITEPDETTVRLAVTVWSDCWSGFRQCKPNCRWKRPRCTVEVEGQESTFHRRRVNDVAEAGLGFRL